MDDIGFMQGVVIVDRLRTMQGLPLEPELHVARWKAGCAAVGIHIPIDLAWETLIRQIVVRNQASFANKDFSIVLLATPGRCSDPTGQPTLILHALPIAWGRLAKWYQEGQTLRTMDPCSVPSACWSATIKTRARLNYYLADRQAQAAAAEDSAAAVLRAVTFGDSPSPTITETSAANLLIVEYHGPATPRIISPPREHILDGISLRRTVRLAQDAGFEVCFEPISVERAEHADEILLTGSTGCLWPAANFNARNFPLAPQRPVYRHLLKLWTEELDYDFTVLQ